MTPPPDQRTAGLHRPATARRPPHRRAAAAVGLACALSLAAAAATIAAPADDAALDRRTHSLAQQLRCVVCQNQSLADSHAPLAIDLKAQVRELLASGRSEDEVVAHLVERYGDFVRYRPPLRPATALLWAGPLLGLAIGALLMARTLRRRAAAPDDAYDDDHAGAGPDAERDAKPLPPRPATP